MDNEIPLGKRTRKYRFFERVPAIISYGAIIALVVLSIVSPVLAAAYLLVVILSMFIKIFGITYHMIVGRSRMDKVSVLNWSKRLADLEDPTASYDRLSSRRNSDEVGLSQHLENLRLMAAAEDGFFPKPSQVYNA